MGFSALDGASRQCPAAVGFANQQNVAIFLANDGRSNFHGRAQSVTVIKLKYNCNI
jgi:hypothetical protein